MSATIYYLSRYWPRSMLPYDVTRPQCVNSHWPNDVHEPTDHTRRWDLYNHNLLFRHAVGYRVQRTGSFWHSYHVSVTFQYPLTHWGLVMHRSLYASVNWVTISAGNDLLPIRHQAITRSNDNWLSVNWTITNEYQGLLIHKHFLSRRCFWACLPKITMTAF